MIKRKGARAAKDIPEEILSQLNEGCIESVNLTEWLAIDQQILLENLLVQHQRTYYFPSVIQKINALKKHTVNTINETIGTELLYLTTQNNDQAFFRLLSQHPADIVRCWAAYMIGKDDALNIKDTLHQIQYFAADKHFGVREICWMAVKPKITAHLETSINLLSKWAFHSDENIRRFSTESIRPRGVWCTHIDALKQTPEIALAILETLKSDPSKYVQDSVGNWLNDAGKTRPDFVISLCNRWEKESSSKATQYIIKKAMRTIRKV
ncbi:DNA alkylation repair protein [Elizabethkingia meningoseptica]|uniref:DNA alkylation repair protein n=1 Tax=Elizabethkingia meningoseptica TaxID=238 RepID=UPI003892AA71